MQTLENKSYFEFVDKEFNEYVDCAFEQLKKENNEYKKLSIELENIYKERSNVIKAIEDNKINQFTDYDVKTMIKLFNLMYKMKYHEMEKIFYLGAISNYYYFKNLDLLK